VVDEEKRLLGLIAPMGRAATPQLLTFFAMVGALKNPKWLTV